MLTGDGITERLGVWCGGGNASYARMPHHFWTEEVPGQELGKAGEPGNFSGRKKAV